MKQEAKQELGLLDQKHQQLLDEKNNRLSELRSNLKKMIRENKLTIESIKKETEEEIN